MYMQKAQFFHCRQPHYSCFEQKPPKISRKLAGSSQLLSTSKRTDSRKRASTWIFSAQKHISTSCNISSLFCLKEYTVQMSLILFLNTGKLLHFTVMPSCNLISSSVIPFGLSAFQNCPTIHEASLLIRRQTETQLPTMVTTFVSSCHNPVILCNIKFMLATGEEEK